MEYTSSSGNTMENITPICLNSKISKSDNLKVDSSKEYYIIFR
jgi:hypothetical protein